ncbi:MAG: HPr family phosphocarrier protein [bacterium]|nr:HPr family phosphocarrier protein [bacterium]
MSCDSEYPLLEVELPIVNETGLHARPCHAIAALASGFESSLFVACHNRQVDGKSILSLMTLSAAQGDQLRFRIQGQDGERLLEEISSLVASGFQEMS